MIRRLIHLTFAAIMLTGVVIAQDVAVRSDHPDEYVVVKGDTLWDISQKYAGISSNEIMQLNNLKNDHSLYIGQQLKIKKKM